MFGTSLTTSLDDGVPLRDVQELLGHRDPRTTAGYDRGRRGLTRQAAALGHLAATLLPDPEPAEHQHDVDQADVVEQLVDQADVAEGLVASEQPAVVTPALSSAGGRVVDLSAELGEPAGSWQVAETAPGSGSWAVLRDGARVGLVRRESTSRGRRGWSARLDTGVPLPAHGDLAAAAGSGLWRTRDLAAAAIARQAARLARRRR